MKKQKGVKWNLSGENSKESDDEKSNDNDTATDRSQKKVDYSYRDAGYWALPENVRSAIDIAKMKSKHSEFYYRLQTLNDKIFVFRHTYYNNMPNF